jgi:hypothetical protein
LPIRKKGDRSTEQTTTPRGEKRHGYESKTRFSAQMK